MSTVYASGKITAEKIANLSFKTTGRIATIAAQENKPVVKGQILAALDSNILRESVAKAKSAENSAQAAFDEFIDVNRWDNLDPQVIHQRAQYQEAWERAKNDLAIANFNLSDSVLISPFAGVVTAVNGEVNEWTSAFSVEPLVQVVDFTTLFFEAEVSQENSSTVVLGQKAEVILDQNKNEKLTGLVHEVGTSTKTSADGDTIIPVKIKFLGSAPTLKLGLKGDAQIIASEQTNVLLVPKSAVMVNSGQFQVSVLKNGSFKKQTIMVGQFDGLNWEVTSGLAEGDTVLLTP